MHRKLSSGIKMGSAIVLVLRRMVRLLDEVLLSFDSIT